MVWYGLVALLGVLLAGALWRLRLAVRRERSARQRLTATLDGTDAAFAVWDEAGRLVACNDRFRAFYPIVTLRPGLDYEDLGRFTATRAVMVVAGVDAWMASWRGRLGRASREMARTPDDRWIELRTTPTAGGETLLTYTDVTAVRGAAAAESARDDRAAEQSASLGMLRRAVATGRDAVSFHHAAREMLELIGRGAQWPAGTMFLMAAGPAAALTASGVWYAADESAWPIETRRGIDAAADDPDDVRRQVVSTKRPVWIGNVDVDPRVSEGRRRALAGARSLCAMPVVAGDRTVAVVEWYSREPQPPDPGRESLMSDALDQLARVFARERDAQLAAPAADPGR